MTLCFTSWWCFTYFWLKVKISTAIPNQTLRLKVPLHDIIIPHNHKCLRSDYLTDLLQSLGVYNFGWNEINWCLFVILKTSIYSFIFNAWKCLQVYTVVGQWFLFKCHDKCCWLVLLSIFDFRILKIGNWFLNSTLFVSIPIVLPLFILSGWFLCGSEALSHWLSAGSPDALGGLKIVANPYKGNARKWVI